MDQKGDWYSFQRSTTPELDAEIVRLYAQENWSIKDIMTKFGVGLHVVQSRLKEAGVHRNKGQGKSRRPSKYWMYEEGCRDCGNPIEPRSKPLPRSALSARSCRTRCPGCEAKKDAAMRARDKKRKLKQRYGLEVDEYNRLVELQMGRCAICGEEKELWVDHDHGSGKARALLCVLCNFRVGTIETIGPELSKYLEYLEQHA